MRPTRISVFNIVKNDLVTLKQAIDYFINQLFAKQE